jgi:hypothetical protein
MLKSSLLPNARSVAKLFYINCGMVSRALGFFSIYEPCHCVLSVNNISENVSKTPSSTIQNRASDEDIKIILPLLQKRKASGNCYEGEDHSAYIE